MAPGQRSKTKQILFSKPVIIALVIMVIFVGTLEFQQIRKRQQFNREVAALKKQEADLIQKNQTLQNGLAYFNNEQYKDMVARQQLNLRKDGEIVVNFPPAVEQQSQEPAAAPKTSNPTKWWNYFFNKQ